MKLFLVLALCSLSGCASTAYNPHYILSDTLDTELTPSQEEVSDPISS